MDHCFDFMFIRMPLDTVSGDATQYRCARRDSARRAGTVGCAETREYNVCVWVEANCRDAVILYAEATVANSNGNIGNISTCSDSRK